MPPPPIPVAATIDDVITSIDTIIDWSVTASSRLGYFAALYKRVTIAVRTAIENNMFDDGPRMRHLDVVFAQRYFDALNGYFHPGDHPKPSRSWNGVFKWANNRAPIIVQHMLAGVSTHILLDLGLAATTVAPGAALPALQEDFDRINAVLASQVNGVVADINELSPLLANLYAVLADREICLINESITVMRDSAWQFATSLNRTPPLFRQLRIRIRDTAVAAQVEVSANYLLLGLGAPIIAAIAATESRDIGHNIGVLNEIASTPAPITTTI